MSLKQSTHTRAPIATRIHTGDMSRNEGHLLGGDHFQRAIKKPINPVNFLK